MLGSKWGHANIVCIVQTHAHCSDCVYSRGTRKDFDWGGWFLIVGENRQHVIQIWKVYPQIIHMHLYHPKGNLPQGRLDFYMPKTNESETDGDNPQTIYFLSLISFMKRNDTVSTIYPMTVL